MADTQSLPLKIGIIGAGFSGTSLALNLSRLTQQAIEIILFEKRGSFGTGEAYSTPFPFHILNVPADNMSVFEEEPEHFVKWLILNQHISRDPASSINEQYVPRLLYGQYLQDLLQKLQSSSSAKCKLTMVADEVIDVITEGRHTKLICSDQKEVKVDKVVFALGNSLPVPFPFPISPEMNCIHKPWDYHLPRQIGKREAVIIVGTGLSMIDTVLTLYHQGHQGHIYALSRHGLLPLPHANQAIPVLSWEENLPTQLLTLFQQMRKKTNHHIKSGGDWRSIMNSMRKKVPEIWMGASLQDKKRFIRHLLPYWNIHRHRVHHHLTDLLKQLTAQQQFSVLAGRVLSVEQGKANIKLRRTHQVMQLEVSWLINCMGPSLNLSHTRGALINAILQQGIASLDPLNVGFMMTPLGALQAIGGHASDKFYTLGPPAKSAHWESSAVPEIRKYSLDLARHLLEIS